MSHEMLTHTEHKYSIELDGIKVGKKYYGSLNEARDFCDRNYNKRLREVKNSEWMNKDVSDNYIIKDLTSKDFIMPYNPSVEGGRHD